MSQEISLSQAIAKAKSSMQRYRSLPEYLLDGVGALLTFWRRPPGQRKPLLPSNAFHAEEAGLLPYWLSGILIGALTFLAGWLASLVLRQPMTIQDIRVSGWIAATGALALIANKLNIRTFLETFNDCILEKIIHPADVQDLENWLNRSFNIIWPLLTGLVGGPLMAWILLSNLHPATIHIGTFVVVDLACIQSTWVAYYLAPFYVMLPARLVRYHFDLYKNDPSSSEVLGRFSRLMTFIMYVTLAYLVILTIVLTQIEVLNLETAIAFSVIIWVPTLVLYIAGQVHISSLIMRAKWDTLNEIQKKIESMYARSLETEDAAIKKDTLDVIDNMMDTHDRIKSTPNSAINIRSSLNFLNSLLLPILAFIVANIDSVLALIKNRLGK